jgi:hypothetical protein
MAEAVAVWVKRRTNRKMNICLVMLFFSPTLNTMPYRPLAETDLKLWEIFHFSCQDEKVKTHQRSISMGEKSKGQVNKKKPAAKSLKEKRAAKQEKKASKSNQG